MPNAPEQDIDQLAAAVTEKVKANTNLPNTLQFLSLILGKPVTTDSGTHTLHLPKGEQQEWLTAIDGFLKDVKNVDPKSVFYPKFLQLRQEHEADLPVGTFPTPTGRKANTTLSNAAYQELHALWVDQQPLS